MMCAATSEKKNINVFFASRKSHALNVCAHNRTSVCIKKSGGGIGYMSTILTFLVTGVITLALMLGMFAVWRHSNRLYGFRSLWCRDADRKDLRELVRLMAEALDAAGIRWCLTFGTLLGYVRHGGHIIPWDDDMDIMVNVEDRPKVAALKRALEMSGSLRLRSTHSDVGLPLEKFSIRRPNDPREEQTWPFCDIFYYEITPSGLIQLHDTASPPGPILPAGSLEPFQTGTFEGVPVHVPRAPEAILSMMYGPKWAQEALPPVYDHRAGADIWFSTRQPVPIRDAIKEAESTCRDKKE